MTQALYKIHRWWCLWLRYNYVERHGYSPGEILWVGPIRGEIEIHTHVSPADPDNAASQARCIVVHGPQPLKTDPFMPEMRQHHRRYMHGTTSPAGSALAVDTTAAIKGTIGPNIDVLIDCHRNLDVPRAISTSTAKLLEPFNIGWF